MTRRTSLLIVGLLWVATFGTLALLSLPAHGQPVTFPLPACITRPNLPVPAASAPPGLPLQWGGQCTATLESNATGGAALLVCPRPAGKPTFALYAVRWSSVTAPMVADFAALGLPGDNAARIRDMQAKYGTLHVLDLCDVWGPARERFDAAYQAGVRPDVVWKVAPFGVQQTRPAFGVLAGRRGPQSATRAPVGAACDCAAPIAEGAVTYCPWTGSGGLVTVCTKP